MDAMSRAEHVQTMNLFTLVHVLISLAGIFSGFIVVAGFMANAALPGWTKVFLVMTILTNITGFLFPFDRVLPSHIVGGISSVVLVVTLFALYGCRLIGRWRVAYVLTAVLALYLNVFVLMAQLFLRIPALQALAPTQSEPPFAVVQVLVLAIFVFLGVKSVRGFHPPASHAV